MGDGCSDMRACGVQQRNGRARRAATVTIEQSTVMFIGTPRTLNDVGNFLRGHSGAAAFGLDQR